jgi:hypothetical protein
MAAVGNRNNYLAVDERVIKTFLGDSRQVW